MIMIQRKGTYQQALECEIRMTFRLFYELCVQVTVSVRDTFAIVA